MKVAIIGSGSVGKALAASAKKAGHTVTLSSRHTENAQEAAKAINAKAAGSNKEAVKDADLVSWLSPRTKSTRSSERLSLTWTERSLSTSATAST